MVDNNWL